MQVLYNCKPLEQSSCDRNHTFLFSACYPLSYAASCPELVLANLFLSKCYLANLFPSKCQSQLSTRKAKNAKLSGSDGDIRHRSVRLLYPDGIAAQINLAISSACSSYTLNRTEWESCMKEPSGKRRNCPKQHTQINL